jgi:hypothetical protein
MSIESETNNLLNSTPQKMDDILSCPVGYELYDDKEHRPYTISSCGHTFCIKCIKQLNKKRCPECRRDFKKIIPNYTLIQVIRHRNDKKKERSSDYLKNNKFRAFNRQYLFGPIKRKMISIKRNLNTNNNHDDNHYQSENNLNTAIYDDHIYINPSDRLLTLQRNSVDVLNDGNFVYENRIVNLNTYVNSDSQKLSKNKRMDKELRKSKLLSTIADEFGKLKFKMRQK